jgi:[acyl-carrier-protein] S-malonyltransferase
VDGRGNIWSPWSTDIQELFSYTLGDQIVRPYDFSSSIDVAVKEFCPDQVVLLGPGNSLGSPVAQVLIENNWNGLNSKSDFLNSQEKDPFVISMGIEEQRNIVL